MKSKSGKLYHWIVAIYFSIAVVIIFLLASGALFDCRPGPPKDVRGPTDIVVNVCEFKYGPILEKFWQIVIETLLFTLPIIPAAFTIYSTHLLARMKDSRSIFKRLDFYIALFCFILFLGVAFVIYFNLSSALAPRR